MALSDRLIAVAIGIAFGVALERAGLGSARKLTGQFFLRDFTVFKVMFTAILTAMLGLFWLARLGLIDPAFVYVPDTYLLPQAVGGLVFGAGFALAGLCPGTSCVAAASGRGDGIAAAGGFFAGVLATGASYPLLKTFYESDPRGVWTLPQLFHAPPGFVVFGIVLAALAGFAAAERIEDSARGFAPRAPLHALSLRSFALLAILALALGAAAALVRTPVRARAAAAAPAPVFRPANGC
jgi:uncharacterized membrane protein YedE/YeeE